MTNPKNKISTYSTFEEYVEDLELYVDYLEKKLGILVEEKD